MNRPLRLACTALAVAFATPSPTRAQCLDWDSRFYPPGTNNDVRAMVAFDDGSGEAVFIGGSFTTAGDANANFIVRWDGADWSTLDSGMDQYVSALAVFDDGSGPALFAGGGFTQAGGVPAQSIAKWDGSAWSPLGLGTNNEVDAVTVFDDGTGPALYAAGQFTLAGGVTANFVARWDGANWSAVGGGVNLPVYALCVFDDGSGPALYAAGSLTVAGGTDVGRIARWDGTSWTDVGGGVSAQIYALTVFDDGTGPALHAGGAFTMAGGGSANRVAKWNGTSWSALGSGIQDTVRALSVFDDGGGAKLIAGGDFFQAGGSLVYFIAQWDGTSWSELAGGVTLTSTTVRSLLAFDHGDGPRLYVGGRFYLAGDKGAHHLARWDGTEWDAPSQGQGLGAQVGIAHASVRALAVFDDGSGPALYAGGPFRTAGTVHARRIAKWDGASWGSLGYAMEGGGPVVSVNALAVFDDGTGPALFAGGEFASAGVSSTSRIAKWNGTTWSALGTGMNFGGSVYALAVFDDGSGPALYAGGQFITAGGVSARSIARWNGSSWTALGSGTDGQVFALAVFDDGTGPALYVGGGFMLAGGVAVQNLAKWNGSSWSDVGGGVKFGVSNGYVSTLLSCDDGSGPALCVGGFFVTAGATNASYIAKWDGATWSAFGSGMDSRVQSLAMFDDGSGSALYAGGSFSNAGGAPASGIARWDGAAWSPVDLGIDGPAPAVFALAVYDDGADGAPDLYLGCQSERAGTKASFAMAQWHGCEPGVAYCFGDGIDALVTAACPCSNFGEPGRGCANSNPVLGGARLYASGSTNPNTVLFTCTGIPNNNLCTFLRGSLDTANGAVFGDGIKCASGTIIRFGQQLSGQGGNASNTVTATPVTVAPGNTRYYQVQYRNPAPAFCPPESFNASNGYRIDW